MEYLPQYNKEAEEAVLGCMLIDENAVIEATQRLTADDFYDQRNKLVFEAMADLFENNDAIDLITLKSKLDTKDTLAKAGGVTYIAALGNSMVSAGNIDEYIDMVKEKSQLRYLNAIGNQLSKDSALEAQTSSEIIDAVESSLMHISRRVQGSKLEHISKVLDSSYEDIIEATTRKGNLIGLSTGFKELDRMTLGFQKSQLIVIGARPGDGKTSLALNIATHVALQEKGTVAIFNLEMSATQLVKRIICSVAMTDLKKACEGSLADDEYDKIISAVGELNDAPIYIDDTAGIGISGINSKCRSLKAQKGLSLIVIDYLQLMKTGKKSENRQLEVAELTRGLKIMARDLDVPVIVLSQLRRESEKRNKPGLSDLRESGSIEQDADTVILIHKYRNEEDTMDLAEFIVAKQRSGPTGTIDVCWRGELTKFICMDGKH